MVLFEEKWDYENTGNIDVVAKNEKRSSFLLIGYLRSAPLTSQ